MKKWKQTAGFTLVELIVVIAILGILACVGTVGYSGYIKKASQAADNTLLGAVNTAFAAACIENGTTNTAQNNVALGDGTTKGTTITTVFGGTMAGTNIPASFEKYLEGNADTLKYYKNDGDIRFYRGMFMAADAVGNMTASWQVGDETYTLTFSNADIDSVNGSTFVNDDLGVDTLLDQVDQITQLATTVLNSDSAGTGTQLINGIITTDDFAAFASKKLGGALSPAEMKDALAVYVNPTLDEITALQERWQGDAEKMAVLTKLASNENLVSNALVLYAAEQSPNLSTDAAFLTELKSMNITGTTIDASGHASPQDMLELGKKAYTAIYGTGGSRANAGTAMAKAAYGYGMSIAYGNYKAQEGNSEVTWEQYLDSDQGKADFAAYASCMSMINSNANTSDATVALLNSGFGDAALAEAIAEALRGN